MLNYRLLVAAALIVQSPLVAQAAPATLIRDGVAATDPQVATSLPQYLQSRSAHCVDWLADGSMLISTRFGDTDQIHRVRTPLGRREQLTFEPAGVISAAGRPPARPPSADGFAYLTPRAGGRTQLFLQPLGSSVPRALTDGSSREGTPVWSPDGTRIAFTSTGRNGMNADVYVLDTAAPAAVARLLIGDGHSWRIYDWSADARHLLLGRELPSDSGQPAETELYLAEVDSGALTPVAGPTGAHPGAGRRGRGKAARSASAAAAPVRASVARFARDGQGIVLLTRDGAGGTGEFLHLSYTDPADGQWRELSTPGLHDVELFDQSADGRYLAYTVDDGQSRLMLIDQQLKLELTVTALPPGLISGLKFDASGKRLAVTLQATRSPPDVYVFEPATHALSRWTQSEVGPLDTNAFAAPQQLQFPTWDRVDGQPRQLRMLLYSPAASAAIAGGARPVVIWLCSGGGAQCRDRYAPFAQYLAQKLGYVVIAPNVRGSSGFGREFQAAGEGALRDDAVRDIGSLLVWIGLQPGLDRNRVALLGEGYGSYLALASLAQYGDRLGGAVAAFPSRLSGLPNVQAIRRPVLLVDGLDDATVPAYESAQLRASLRAQGVAVQYLAAAGEGRQFDRQSDREAYYTAAASFLVQLWHHVQTMPGGKGSAPK